MQNVAVCKIRPICFALPQLRELRILRFAIQVSNPRLSSKANSATSLRSVSENLNWVHNLTRPLGLLNLFSSATEYITLPVSLTLIQNVLGLILVIYFALENVNFPIIAHI